MPDEIVLALSAYQAATGTTATVQLPGSGEPFTVQIPPVQDGSVLRFPTPAGEILVRIQVTGAPTPGMPYLPPPGSPYLPPGAPRPRNSAKPAGIAAAVVGLVVVTAIIVAANHHSSPVSTPPIHFQAPTFSYSPIPLPSISIPPIPTFSDPFDSPSADDTGNSQDSPSPDPTFSVNDCLSGTLPDSTTAQSVQGVDVVPCSASNAHYKVIKTYTGTTDLNSCDADSDTQYAFSQEETWGGATISSEVYCVIGLGSYAR